MKMGTQCILCIFYIKYHIISYPYTTHFIIPYTFFQCTSTVKNDKELSSIILRYAICKYVCIHNTCIMYIVYPMCHIYIGSYALYKPPHPNWYTASWILNNWPWETLCSMAWIKLYVVCINCTLIQFIMLTMVCRICATVYIMKREVYSE